MKRTLAALLVLQLLSVASSGVYAAEAAWDVTRSYGATRSVDFFTDEGTDLSVDVSPDGRWIVFDLLGHLYRMPAAGGEAELLTAGSGQAINYHPRYSPDGGRIAFISDRGGQNNLWLMNADGSAPRPLVLDLATRFAQPAWTPDGQSIVVTRIHGAPRVGMEKRILQLWIYSAETGAGRALVAVEGSQAEWPSVSADGRHVYYESAWYGDEEYTGYHLERIELATGKREPVTRADSIFRAPTYRVARMREFTPANEFAPEISPDGKYLAFARRILGGESSIAGHEYKDRTALWLRNLATGQERIVLDPIDPDRTGTYARGVLRPVSGYAWLPDSQALLVPVNGKLRRVNIDTGAVATVPFKAHVRRQLSAMAAPRSFRATDTFQPRFLQWPAPSPDGRKLVFYAAGQLWIQSRGAATPRALAPMPDRLQLMPAWSPDGRWLAFVTWKDGEQSQVWKVAATGGAPIALTAGYEELLHPSWRADGREIAVVMGAGASLRGDALSANVQWSVGTLPATGGKVVHHASLPALTPVQWAADGRFYFLDTAGNVPALAAQLTAHGLPPTAKVLCSTNAAGQDLRQHALFSVRTERASLSEDARRIAWQDGFEVFEAELPGSAAPARADQLPPLLDYYAQESLGVARKLSVTGGWYPVWRGGAVEFVSGSRYFSYDTSRQALTSQEIRLRIPRFHARGTLALTGATLLSMVPGQAPRVGTLIVKDGRIHCVFDCSTRGADRVLDMTGRFVAPGLIDVHDHTHLAGRAARLASRHDPHSALQLAYGVTTTVDPYGVPEENPFMAELIEVGRVPGPRSFYTSLGIHDNHAAEHIEHYADAERQVELYAGIGAIGIKNFHLTNRRQSQMLAVATQAHGGLYLTAEQGDLPYVIGLLLDGHSGWEHMLSYDTLHRDVTQFVGQAGVTYSPTLIVGGLQYWGSEYFVGRDRPWQDPKFTRFLPWQWLTALPMFAARPRSDFAFPFLAEGVAGIVRAGGNAAIGAHGEMPGLGAHVEMQIYASAMTPLEVLHMATLGGAKFTGLDREVGSLEPGKLADLIVLTADPLLDIRHTLSLESVMKDGVLYDANTLDERWPTQTPYGPVPWTSASDLGPRSRAIDRWDH